MLCVMMKNLCYLLSASSDRLSIVERRKNHVSNKCQFLYFELTLCTILCEKAVVKMYKTESEYWR